MTGKVTITPGEAKEENEHSGSKEYFLMSALMGYFFKVISFLLPLVLCSSMTCNSYYYLSDIPGPDEAYDPSEIVYSVFLIGDGGRAYSNPPELELIRTHLKGDWENRAVIFLGDNVYPRGLPNQTSSLWSRAHESLSAQLELVKNFPGKIFFIPGNRDWANGGKEGLEYVKNQRKYIEDFLQRKNIFLPKKGKPGPVEINLTGDLVLIIIDSQWWFHENAKNYSDEEDEGYLFDQLEEAVNRNMDKKIIIASHYPLYSAGLHGGHFPFSRNIFPLLDLNKSLYVPLPGFVYTFFRRYFGGKEDLSHPAYRIYRDEILESIKGHSNVIFAAGHEHNLQYVEKNSLHHIVSGSAGISEYVSRNRKTGYAQAKSGLARLVFLQNGDVWLEFWTIRDERQSSPSMDSAGVLSFRKKIFNKPVFVNQEHEKFLSTLDYTDSTVIAYPHGEKYKAGAVKKILMGENYRKEWVTPVEVPVFDFNHEKGGLEIIKKGGGMQTKSLRLEDKNKKEWVLRSIEKDPSAVIPEELQTTFSEDMIQDQMSANLPWAALAVPRLADATGVFHTNPKMVYLAKDPRLGKYIDKIDEGIYLFEERPAGNRKDVESFGRSEDIISTQDLLDNLAESPGHKVDQAQYLRSRLLDILISDWDRHGDQWRWAKFKEGGKTVYRPIPRDRDQTFYLNEGILPWISSRKFALRKNQGLDYDVKDMGGLTYQARHLDRRILNELNMKDWIEIADIMQVHLTDRVIEDAINDMPKPIVEISGPDIIAKLKSRRDKLQDFAKSFYSLISREVDIVGTNEPDLFEVERLNNNETSVSIYSLDHHGNRKDKYFHRVFITSETKEIRLYGLGGNDVFMLSGRVRKGIRIRIVGGRGNDKYTDHSRVAGLSGKTILYDTKNNTSIEPGKETRIKTSDNPLKNQYVFDAFNYPKAVPLSLIGHNVDDGFLLGAGLVLTTYGFQKFPFAVNQKLRLSYSFSVKAPELEYNGIFTDAIRGFDLNVDADIRSPKYVQNYFGMGNETEKETDDPDYYRVRIGQIHVQPSLVKHFNTGNTLSLGLFFNDFNIEDTPGRFITEFNGNGLDSGIFRHREFLGLSAGYRVDTRDNKVLPVHGIYWNSSVGYSYGLSGTSKKYANISTDLRFYLSFRKPYRTVLAFRAGGSVNAGSPEFFQACSLGGKSNLRGFRATRFSGDACLYQNSELRLKVFEFSNYFLKGDCGLIGFNDIGRVWVKGEHSTKWHDGYGGGIWISPFKLAVLIADYEMSTDEDPGLFSVRFSYLF